METINNNELSTLREEVQQEKQIYFEIYQIAFEDFLNTTFRKQCLKSQIKKAMERGENHLLFQFGYYSGFSFRNMVKETFFNTWLKLVNFERVKKEFKSYKKNVEKLVSPFSTPKIKMREIKDIVVDNNAIWKSLLEELKKAGITTEVKFIEDKEIFELRLSW
ncbi:hypothetical protein RW25_15770 [Bacillus sp. L_1B0_8]|uniref:hypothetical protein n=1 Tax=unclassified Bacillus (in: firmicutes) TaxID=185979 RepID=UPI0005B6E2E1|nr:MULTISPECIES: hypothetical protein [unclassified Bacillus (in: firmicutes)]KIQ87406.1 hypothetical protein RW25_15770 [Bacillus sp. L_1B0_8]KIQ89377.1 hypothetical protein RT27_07285 [Bacillus sp. L_1B0_5]